MKRMGKQSALKFIYLARRPAGLVCTLALAALAFAAPPPASSPSAGGVFAAALRRHIRHVFVIYQENRSFDSYFGTYPGVDNLATAEARRHGFRQYDPLGKTWVTPYRLLDADLADPAHDRPTLLAKADHGRMDRFIAAQEALSQAHGARPAVARRLGLLTMAYEDCHTIPFLWRYAHRFALYDHFFQGMYGPSTPGNIDLIAAQTGQTQWARNPQEAVRNDTWGRGEPVVDDVPPAWGPYRHGVPPKRQYDQRYATLLLTLAGRRAGLAQRDTRGVRRDIADLQRLHRRPIAWGWYQEGFGNGRGNLHPAYIAHHDAPQYFGYIRQNPPLWQGVHGLRAFFRMLGARRLPARSVSFIKGGLRNPFGWRPAAPAGIARHFLGDDDHPGYSDSQLSEALVAKTVNAIAKSPYWPSSAILILWDDSGGFYDHVPPPQFERCPDHHPCGDGPRVPLLLISPYARAGAVVHQPGDHASFARFLDALFQLPPLASLPDERPWLPLGPRDGNPRLGNLLHGFSAARLEGRRPPIAPRRAEIPARIVNGFPPAMSCRQAGVEPVRLSGTSPAGLGRPSGAGALGSPFAAAAASAPQSSAPSTAASAPQSAPAQAASVATSPQSAPSAGAPAEKVFSLAKFARAARAASALAPPAQRVFTNASLKGIGAISVAGAPPPPPRRPAALSAKARQAPAKQRALWVARFKQLRTRLQTDQRQLIAARRQFQLNQVQYYKSPNVELRQYARAHMKVQQQQVEALTARLAADHQALDKLQRRFRRAKLPASWLH